MDGLRGLLAKKKAELRGETKTFPSKYVKRSVLEERELKRRREEEEEERERKLALLHERKKRYGVKESAPDQDDEARGGDPTHTSSSAVVPPAILALSQDEVTRRLRLLNEPKRLFAETDNDRYVRLVLAEKSFRVAEEDAGGQQANLHLLFERQEKEETIRRLKETANRKETGRAADAGNGAGAGTQQTREDGAGARYPGRRLRADGVGTFFLCGAGVLVYICHHGCPGVSALPEGRRGRVHRKGGAIRRGDVGRNGSSHFSHGDAF